MKQVFAHYPRDEPEVGGFRYCPTCGTRLKRGDQDDKLRPTCPSCGFVQYRNPAPTVSILVVEGNQVLLGRRGGPPGAGTWSLPSGYVEYEDNFLTAALREVKEETGLDVELCSLVNVVSSFVSPRFHFLGLYLAARVVGGELQAGDDLTAVEWFPLLGPLPDMGFQEDVEIIHLYAQGFTGLPLDPSHVVSGDPAG
jgi:ADP-ribose pyrophosphatase YjhB (NUDIX family)